MNRRNQILAGFLAVQLIVVGFVLWPRRSASSGEATSLFPGVTAEQIVSLTIGDATGNSINLAKEGDAWVLPDVDSYPTQADKVTGLVDKIVGLKTGHLVAQTSTSYKRLKVATDDYERLVQFNLADGTAHKLYVGTSPSYGATHVRADDQAGVYLTPDLSISDVGVGANNWVDTAYLNVPADQVVAVTLENANGRFEFTKTNDTWTMQGLAAGETLDQSQVTALVNKARYVVLSRPLGKTADPAYGMDTPGAVVTIQAHSEDAGDQTYTLTVGAKDTTDSTYTVKSSESPYYVRASSYSVEDLVQKDHEGFLLQPPTPTPEPGATPSGS
jgi:hypothetical protein